MIEDYIHERDHYVRLSWSPEPSSESERELHHKTKGPVFQEALPTLI